MGKDRVPQEVRRVVGELRAISPFSSLSGATLARVVTQARHKRFERGDLLVVPGDPGDRVFLIVSGLVWVGVYGSDGRSIPQRLCTSGALLGTFGLLGEKPGPEYARALSDGHAFQLPFHLLRERAERSPRFAIALGRAAADEALLTKAHLLGMLCLEVARRLAIALLMLAERFGVSGVGTNGRELLIDVPLRHQDLADVVGCSRETASKALSRLSNRGLIRSDDGRITVIDEETLRRVASPEPADEGDAAHLA